MQRTGRTGGLRGGRGLRCGVLVSVLLTVALGLIGLGVSGCTGGGASTKPDTNGTSSQTSTGSANTKGSGKEGVTLHVMMNGGKYEDVARKAVIGSFEKKNNATVEIVPATSSEILTRLKAEKLNPSQDLVVIDEIVAVEGVDQGLFERLNPASVPNLKDLEESALDKDGYGPLVHSNASNIGYNKDLLKVSPPQSWADLWNPKYKDMLVLPNVSNTGGMLFLLQAAMMNGGGYDNISPGIEALKKLAPNVRKYFNAVGEVRPLLGEGALVLSGNNIWNDEIDKGNPIGIAFPREGSLAMPATIQIVNGTKNKDLAEKLVNMFLSPEAQAGFGREFYFKVYNKKMSLPEEVRARIPQNVIALDSRKIMLYREKWLELWRKEIGR